jgi:glycine cleavage system aminomethyltransferase T
MMAGDLQRFAEPMRILGVGWGGIIIKQSALFNRLHRSGAAWTDHYGWQVPASFTAAGPEAASVRESVGLADLSWTLKLDLRGYGLRRPLTLGDDAFSWDLGPLHRLVTCEPPARNAILERLEALQADGSDGSGIPPIYMTDVTSVFAQFLLAGPRSRQVLGKLTSVDAAERSLPDLSCRQTSLAHVGAMILRKDFDGVPAFHVLVSREYGESVWDAMLHAGHEFRLSPFGLQAQQLLGV